MVGIAHLCIPPEQARSPLKTVVKTVEVKHRVAWSQTKAETPETKDGDQKKMAAKTRATKTKPKAKKAARKEKVTAPKVKRGRPFRGATDKTLTAQAPWNKEGVSRATWYRQNPGGKPKK